MEMVHEEAGKDKVYVRRLVKHKRYSSTFFTMDSSQVAAGVQVAAGAQRARRL
jgi:hypothetical protein